LSHLLDVNALIALGWTQHEHHETMARWFRAHARDGWATCAFTQAAFVRVIAQPAFSGQAIGIGEIVELLLRNTSHPKHRLVPLDFGFEQVIGRCTGGLLGHRQVTDAWLLALAIRHGMKLLTFDSGVAQLLASAKERQLHLSILV
jgi:toxin-antitoxin system PIN domain toxin